MPTKQTPVQIAIVAAAFNRAIVGPMIEEANAVATSAGAEICRHVEVAGCYEIPLVADALLRDERVELVVVLGYIEKGETLHGEVMGHVVQAALVELQLKHRKPIGSGIVGPGATLPQAETRKLSCARSAVQAALSSLAVLASLRGTA